MAYTIVGLLLWILLASERVDGVSSTSDRTLYWTPAIGDTRQSRIYYHHGDPEQFLQSLRDGSSSVGIKYSHFPSSAAKFGAIAADHRPRRSVFSHNKVNGKIYKFYLENISATSIFRGSSEQVTDLAVDWISQNLYYTDPKAGIGLLSYNDAAAPKSTIILNTRSVLNGIDVDPQAGYLFYTDTHAGHVYRASLTGDERKVLTDARTSKPTHLVVDVATHTVYWLDEGRSELQAWNYDTAQFRNVWSNDRIGSGDFPAIEIYKTYIFLPLKESTGINVVQSNGTYLQDFTTSSFRQVQTGGICMSAPENQPNTESACDVGNGGCQHICVHVSSTSRRCLCQFGYTLQRDGASCGSDLPHDNFLIMADPESKALYLVEPGAGIFHAVPLPVISSEQSDDATYDPVDMNLYWTERNLNQIWRMNIISQEAELFYSLNSQSTNQGIVLDPESRHLYYTDATLKRIGMIDLLTKNHSVVLQLTGSERPLDIQIDQNNSHIYWTNRGYRPSIERADLTGKNRHTVVSSGLREPSGLALDITAGHLYFVDMERRTLERVDLDGSRRLLITHVSTNTIGVAVDDDYIYVAHRVLMKIRKADNATSDVGPHYFGAVFGMAYYCSNSTGCSALTPGPSSTTGIGPMSTTTTKRSPFSTSYGVDAFSTEEGPISVPGRPDQWGVIIIALGVTGGVILLVGLVAAAVLIGRMCFGRKAYQVY